MARLVKTSITSSIDIIRKRYWCHWKAQSLSYRMVSISFCIDFHLKRYADFCKCRHCFWRNSFCLLSNFNCSILYNFVNCALFCFLIYKRSESCFLLSISSIKRLKNLPKTIHRNSLLVVRVNSIWRAILPVSQKSPHTFTSRGIRCSENKQVLDISVGPDVKPAHTTLKIPLSNTKILQEIFKAVYWTNSHNTPSSLLKVDL